MSGDSPPTNESCEALCEWLVADIEDIAGSIEDVRGMARARAALCSGTEAMVGVAVGCLPLSFVAMTGSDALRAATFNGRMAGSGLEMLENSSPGLFKCQTDLCFDAEDICELSGDS